MRNISNDAKKTAVALLMKYAVNFLSDVLFTCNNNNKNKCVICKFILF